MSRHGYEDRTAILAAATRWKEEALLSERSVFGVGALWTPDGFKGLEKFFVDNLDEGEGNFIGKLEGQLSQAPTAVKQLASELTWVMLLCPSNTHPPKKRETVELIWRWSGQSLPNSAKAWLTDEVLAGIGSAGPGYNNHRWRELVFAIRFGLAFKALSQGERAALLSDGWKFAEWLAKLPEANVRQFRHMLVYLLFPDSFERIFGGGDRRLLVQKFKGLSLVQVRKLSPLQIDRELANIRSEQQTQNPDAQLDFYEEPLKSQWQPTGFDEFTADIEATDVLEAIKEIDETGVPASAESTIYDLIVGSKRYPPKLVLSLAAKHVLGKEFDRSLFSGGIDSPAFNLLRGLGFHIERKDFLPELLKRFLEQANEGVSQVVSGYPDSYRTLTVRVGFGKGKLAKVPWIAFLGYRQQIQNGIYPVLLYYKAEQLLVLARGVSDTETSTKLWPSATRTKTIDQLFIERFSYEAERYGESFVYRPYRIPADIAYEVIAQDLDNLVTEYHELMSQGHPSPLAAATAAATVVVAPVASEPEPTPYTVKEATEALFITQERFEEILAIWRQKKNLVVQGPPGVGKTFFYRRLAYALMGSAATARIASVQFHPSYSYEDFVQGYRPAEGGFVLREGIFYRFCQRARKDSGHSYVFVIDEINRGNLARIFGELLMLLEGDKRNAEWAMPLAYGGPSAEPFFIPDNVYLLGLMNTADRSLAVVDYALRRRFAFVDLKPEFTSPRFSEHLKEKGINEVLLRRIIERMTAVNDEIARDRANLGPGYRIGHSFFCDPPEESALHEDWYQQVVKSEIAPLLDEYYFDDSERAQALVQRLLRGG